MQWNRRKTALAVPFLVLIVSVVGGWALSRSSDNVDANLTTPGTAPFPTIGTNVENTGTKFRFVELVDSATGERGTISPNGRAMVINFWFSTCEPCKREMPVLSAAATKYRTAVDFIGVNPNDTPEMANAFMKKYQIRYASFIDDGAQLAKAGVATLPATFVLDGEGFIVKRFAGEVTADDLDEALAPLVRTSA